MQGQVAGAPQVEPHSGLNNLGFTICSLHVWVDGISQISMFASCQVCCVEEGLVPAAIHTDSHTGPRGVCVRTAVPL